MANEGLEVRALDVSRGGRRVLRQVSLNVEPGRVTALLGANGAGKSTLVLAIAGALPVDAGQVLVDDNDITGQRPEVVRMAGVAAVPEGHQVLTSLTAEDNLIAAGSQLSSTELKQALDYALSVFPELQALLKQPAGTMSGGQQQMVALAQALVTRPKYLLFDELSLGLAPLIVQRLMAVVEQVVEAGIGVLLIEQFTTIALKLAHHVYVLDRGVIYFEGTPAELEANPGVLQDAYLAGKFTTAG
jgi:branched-chain amino acid transport system ATP-binding protein